jgi:hypothetical protein
MAAYLTEDVPRGPVVPESEREKLDRWLDGRGRPSIHMPRWASRLTLDVSAVRVQRLQEISSADAIAEGIPAPANSSTIDCETPDPRDAFRSLWESIHGKGAWEANPWIAAVSFSVHQINVDQLLKQRAAAAPIPESPAELNHARDQALREIGE